MLETHHMVGTFPGGPTRTLASTGLLRSKVTLMMVQIISSRSRFEAYCRGRTGVREGSGGGETGVGRE